MAPAKKRVVFQGKWLALGPWLLIVGSLQAGGAVSAASGHCRDGWYPLSGVVRGETAPGMLCEPQLRRGAPGINGYGLHAEWIDRFWTDEAAHVDA
ncbi:MAG: hypothetical protein ABS97_08570 [Lysobacteraceae bacterium SCN 69-320]|nr:MAG: hypothetical protein ABS97_08570 [Xanthomonadaceae bacterium SCN 69-320]